VICSDRLCRRPWLYPAVDRVGYRERTEAPDWRCGSGRYFRRCNPGTTIDLHSLRSERAAPRQRAGLVCLAGFIARAGPAFVEAWRDRMVQIFILRCCRRFPVFTRHRQALARGAVSAAVRAFRAPGGRRGTDHRASGRASSPGDDEGAFGRGSSRSSIGSIRSR